MTANWFIALPVSAGDWFDARVRAAPEGFRRFSPHDLHLTVAFLGPCGEATARAAWAERARWHGRSAIDVRLGAVVPMGNPRRYSALSALLAEGHDAVVRGIVACRDAMCDAAGAPRDTRPPKPHLTLARPRRSAGPRERDAGLAWARGIDLRGVTVTLARLALYTWSEARAERQFAIVEQAALSALGEPAG